MTFVMRSRIDPVSLLPSIHRAVASVDPTQPIYDLETMQQRINVSALLVRFELFHSWRLRWPVRSARCD
jgi:hypothetical protein